MLKNLFEYLDAYVELSVTLALCQLAAWKHALGCISLLLMQVSPTPLRKRLDQGSSSYQSARLNAAEKGNPQQLESTLGKTHVLSPFRADNKWIRPGGRSSR